MLQAERSGVRGPVRSEFFSIYVMLPAALGHGVCSASNRNEYQKQKNNVSGSSVGPLGRVDNLTAICEPIV
jgi:hypothetical protein